MKRGGGESTVSSAQCVPHQSYFQRYTSPSVRTEKKQETEMREGKIEEKEENRGWIGSLTALSPRRIVSSRWLQLSPRFF